MNPKKIMRLDEFISAEPTIKPKTPVAPPSAPPITRPSRPIPTIRPGEKEKGKPMASAEELLDQFFDLLGAEKESKFGQRIIKKLYKKYAQGEE